MSDNKGDITGMPEMDDYEMAEIELKK